MENHIIFVFQFFTLHGVETIINKQITPFEG